MSDERFVETFRAALQNVHVVSKVAKLRDGYLFESMQHFLQEVRQIEAAANMRIYELEGKEKM
jgi:hypothetical protein